MRPVEVFSVDQRLPKQERLALQRDIDRVFREGWSVSDPFLVIRAVENGLPFSRLGVMVGRKHGKAVRRNRIKRWVREAYRRNKAELPVGLDIVVVPRAGVELDYHTVERSLRQLAQDLERKRRSRRGRADRGSRRS